MSANNFNGRKVFIVGAPNNSFNRTRNKPAPHRELVPSRGPCAAGDAGR